MRGKHRSRSSTLVVNALPAPSDRFRDKSLTSFGLANQLSAIPATIVRSSVPLLNQRAHSESSPRVFRYSTSSVSHSVFQPHHVAQDGVLSPESPDISNFFDTEPRSPGDLFPSPLPPLSTAQPASSPSLAQTISPFDSITPWPSPLPPFSVITPPGQHQPLPSPELFRAPTHAFSSSDCGRTRSACSTSTDTSRRNLSKKFDAAQGESFSSTSSLSYMSDPDLLTDSSVSDVDASTHEEPLLAEESATPVLHSSLVSRPIAMPPSAPPPTLSAAASSPVAAGSDGSQSEPAHPLAFDSDRWCDLLLALVDKHQRRDRESTSASPTAHKLCRIHRAQSDIFSVAWSDGTMSLERSVSSDIGGEQRFAAHKAVVTTAQQEFGTDSPQIDTFEALAYLAQVLPELAHTLSQLPPPQEQLLSMSRVARRAVVSVTNDSGEVQWSTVELRHIEGFREMLMWVRPYDATQDGLRSLLLEVPSKLTSPLAPPVGDIAVDKVNDMARLVLAWSDSAVKASAALALDSVCPFIYPPSSSSSSDGAEELSFKVAFTDRTKSSFWKEVERSYAAPGGGSTASSATTAWTAEEDLALVLWIVVRHVWIDHSSNSYPISVDLRSPAEQQACADFCASLKRCVSAEEWWAPDRMRLWLGDSDFHKVMEYQCYVQRINAEEDLERGRWSEVGRQVCKALREGDGLKARVTTEMVSLFLSMFDAESEDDNAPAHQCLKQLLEATGLRQRQVVDGLRSVLQLKFDHETVTLSVEDDEDAYCFLPHTSYTPLSSGGLPQIALVRDRTPSRQSMKSPLTILRATTTALDGSLLFNRVVPHGVRSTLFVDLFPSFYLLPLLRIKHGPTNSSQLRAGQLISDAVLGNTAFTFHCSKRQDSQATDREPAQQRVHRAVGVVVRRDSPRSELRAWIWLVNSQSVHWLHEVSSDFFESQWRAETVVHLPAMEVQRISVVIEDMAFRSNISITRTIVDLTDPTTSPSSPALPHAGARPRASSLTSASAVSRTEASLHAARRILQVGHPGSINSPYFKPVAPFFPEQHNLKMYKDSGSINRSLGYLLAFGNQAPLGILAPRHGILAAFHIATTNGQQLLGELQANDAEKEVADRLERWMKEEGRWATLAEPLLKLLQSTGVSRETADSLHNLLLSRPWFNSPDRNLRMCHSSTTHIYVLSYMWSEMTETNVLLLELQRDDNGAFYLQRLVRSFVEDWPIVAIAVDPIKSTERAECSDEHDLCVIIQLKEDSANEYNGVFTRETLLYERLRDLCLLYENPAHQCAMEVPGLSPSRLTVATNFGTRDQTQLFGEWWKKERPAERGQRWQRGVEPTQRQRALAEHRDDEDDLGRLDAFIDAQTQKRPRRRSKRGPAAVEEHPPLKGQRDVSEHASHIRSGVDQNSSPAPDEHEESEAEMDFNEVEDNDGDVRATAGRRRRRISDDDSEQDTKNQKGMEKRQKQQEQLEDQAMFAKLNSEEDVMRWLQQQIGSKMPDKLGSAVTGEWYQLFSRHINKFSKLLEANKSVLQQVEQMHDDERVSKKGGKKPKRTQHFWCSVFLQAAMMHLPKMQQCYKEWIKTRKQPDNERLKWRMQAWDLLSGKRWRIEKRAIIGLPARKPSGRAFTCPWQDKASGKTNNMGQAVKDLLTTEMIALLDDTRTDEQLKSEQQQSSTVQVERQDHSTAVSATVLGQPNSRATKNSLRAAQASATASATNQSKPPPKKRAREQAQSIVTAAIITDNSEEQEAGMQDGDDGLHEIEQAPPEQRSSRRRAKVVNTVTTSDSSRQPVDQGAPSARATARSSSQKHQSMESGALNLRPLSDRDRQQAGVLRSAILDLLRELPAVNATVGDVLMADIDKKAGELAALTGETIVQIMCRLNKDQQAEDEMVQVEQSMNEVSSSRTHASQSPQPSERVIRAKVVQPGQLTGPQRVATNTRGSRDRQAQGRDASGRAPPSRRSTPVVNGEDGAANTRARSTAPRHRSAGGNVRETVLYAHETDDVEDQREEAWSSEQQQPSWTEHSQDAADQAADDEEQQPNPRHQLMTVHNERRFASTPQLPSLTSTNYTHTARELQTARERQMEVELATIRGQLAEIQRREKWDEDQTRMSHITATFNSVSRLFPAGGRESESRQPSGGANISQALVLSRQGGGYRSSR